MTTTRHFLLATLALFALVFAGFAHAQARPAPLVEGEDYVTIPQGIPFANAKGKVEIAEVFGYWCHHCNDFQPMVDAWKPRLPAKVDFVYVPATFDPDDAFARAYFAARALKLPTRVHNELFRAVHVDRSLPMNASERELADFHSRYGVSAAKFLETMDSRGVAAQMRWARKFLETSGAQGTPTLIVAGKYRVLGRSKQDVLRIAAQLAAQLPVARP